MMADLLDRLNEVLADRYSIESEVGRGGMATVFLATDLRHKRKVAIKVLHPDLAASVGSERFLREIEILARLNHPHILSLLDSGQADGLLYYVMPYVEGETLRERLTRESQLPIEDAVQITREVADALGYAHGQGVVHRDIKPANIMFLAGHAVVTDFGIAQAVTEAGGDQLTQTGLSVGTPFYMSPEQATGAESVDARSDLYSLGCVLYEMVGGEPPYTGPSSQAILSRHSQAEIPAVGIIRPQTPPQVRGVIEKALAKSPADRFRTAEHMRKALSGEVTVAAVRRLQVAASPAGKRAVIPAVIVLFVAAAALAVLRPWARDTGQVAEESGIQPGSIAILPFITRGDFERPLDGRSLAALLRTMFGQTDRYHPVPGAAVHEAVESCEEPGGLCGSRVALALDTQFYIWGQVFEIGQDSVRIDANMVDAIDGTQFAPVTVTGRRDEPLTLLDELNRQLWITPARGDPDRVAAVAGATTGVLEALQHFLDGEEYLAEFRTDSAWASYARATELDSTFALAWYRRAVIEDWQDAPWRALPSARRAVAHAERLSPRDRRALDAHLALIQGDASAAERIYRDLVAEDDNDFEAWMQLGYVRYAHNPRRGRSRAECVEPLHRALELAVHPLAAVYLSWCLAVAPEPVEERLAEIDSLATATGDYVAVLTSRVLGAIKKGDSVVVAAALDSMRQYGRGVGAWTFVYLGTVHGDVPDLAMWAEHVAGASDSAHLEAVVPPVERHDFYVRYGRVAGLRFRAALEAGQGRWSAVKPVLREMSTLGGRATPMPDAAELALLATLPFVDPVPVALDSLRQELEIWMAHDDLTRGTDYEVTAWDNRFQIYYYLLGLMSAHEGDYESALAYADTVQLQNAPNEFESSISQDLAEGVRAEVHLRAGRPDEALAALERAPRHVHMAEARRSEFLAGGREVFLRARALQELGRFEEAIGVYAATNEMLGLGPATLAQSHYYRGEIYEELGDTAQAIWHYEAFTELWKDADPELMVTVREVLQHVAELKGEALDVAGYRQRETTSPRDHMLKLSTPWTRAGTRPSGTISHRLSARTFCCDRAGPVMRSRRSTARYGTRTTTRSSTLRS
jgi:tetratricopeptide (TPR) repeat protein/tRNA A-37 threonylcarbamoyl transferase component Bud32